MVHDVLVHHIQVAHPAGVKELVSFLDTSPLFNAWHSVSRAAQDALGSLSGALHLPLAVGADPEPTGPHVVEYYAKDCPHCVHLNPIWQDAKHQWTAEHPDGAGVTFQQKECYGPGWGKGRDYVECQKLGVGAFPTIKFFPSAQGAGEDYDGDRTPEGIQDFLQSRLGEKVHQASASDAAAGAAEAAEAGPRVVEYYAKSCPHCQHLEPTWKAAKQEWDSKHGFWSDGVAWEQKECFGDGWAKGKDFKECRQAGVEAFPTIKFYSPDSGVVDFHGDRTPDKLLEFVESSVDKAAHEEIAKAGAAESQPSAQAEAVEPAGKVAQAAAPAALAVLQAPRPTAQPRSRARGCQASQASLASFL